MGANHGPIEDGEKKRLLRFETWCYRKNRQASWGEKVTKEEVFRITNQKRKFLQ